MSIYSLKVGDIFHWRTFQRPRLVECVVLETSPIDGHITKAKATNPHPILGKIGFMQEGEDWVVQEWLLWPN